MILSISFSLFLSHSLHISLSISLSLALSLFISPCFNIQAYQSLYWLVSSSVCPSKYHDHLGHTYKRIGFRVINYNVFDLQRLKIANPGSTSASQMGCAFRRISFVTVHTIVQTNPTKVIAVSFQMELKRVTIFNLLCSVYYVCNNVMPNI